MDREQICLVQKPFVPSHYPLNIHTHTYIHTHTLSLVPRHHTTDFDLVRGVFKFMQARENVESGVKLKEEKGRRVSMVDMLSASLRPMCRGNEMGE